MQTTDGATRGSLNNKGAVNSYGKNSVGRSFCQSPDRGFVHFLKLQPSSGSLFPVVTYSIMSGGWEELDHWVPMSMVLSPVTGSWVSDPNSLTLSLILCEMRIMCSSFQEFSGDIIKAWRVPRTIRLNAWSFLPHFLPYNLLGIKKT